MLSSPLVFSYQALDAHSFIYERQKRIRDRIIFFILLLFTRIKDMQIRVIKKASSLTLMSNEEMALVTADINKGDFSSHLHIYKSVLFLKTNNQKKWLKIGGWNKQNLIRNRVVRILYSRTNHKNWHIQNTLQSFTGLHRTF